MIDVQALQAELEELKHSAGQTKKSKNDQELNEVHMYVLYSFI